MVDDPSEYTDELLDDPAKKRAAQQALRKFRPGGSRSKATQPADRPALADVTAEIERKRLFGILEALVRWENTTNENALERARTEIWQSWRRACAENADHPQAAELFNRHRLPAFHDPFAGGGSLPLEAQRLGLEAHASDLNPVAVLINKAMIEIPPKFFGQPSVNPESLAEQTIVERPSQGTHGLAEDVRYYGRWMRDEAKKQIGHLYPTIEITPQTVRERRDLKPYEGRKLTVIAWLWARTVKSPNPAFADVDVPLVATFMLSTKKGKEAYVEPVVEGRAYRFTVKVGVPPDAEGAKSGTKLSRGANFRCLMSGSPIASDYVKSEGQTGRMSARLMAIVAKGNRSRVYLTPTAEHEGIPGTATSEWRPEGDVPARLTGGTCVPYGLSTWGDLFTARQLIALTTFSDLVGEATRRVRRDAVAAGLPDDERPLRDGGTSATAYAEAVGVYLAFVVDRLADYHTAFGRWQAQNQQLSNMFGRQAIPMVWDYPEANPFSRKGGSFDNLFDWTIQSIPNVGLWGPGTASQIDAGVQTLSSSRVVSTDPPYYNNIGYADLSDFFYVWLRNSLQPVFPELFATLAVPKSQELVATPYRHGDAKQAEAFFLRGMTRAFRQLSERAHSGFPVTIYYAFKQSERKGDGGIASTGWETFLAAVIRSGFAITGTWPMRTELGNRMISMGTNALASSIVLVCRRRSDDTQIATRRKFLTELRSELPQAVRLLQTGNVAPVDLAQATIGPGIGVYTRYAKVIDAAGNPLSVREALALINEILDEVLTEHEGDLDDDSRWAVAWFEEHGFNERPYGAAELLSTAKNTAVAGMVNAGIVESKGGKVRLLTPEELPATWTPAADTRLTTWETVHHLIRVLENQGETAAAEIIAALGNHAETARELCYRLYTLCDRKKRAAEALRYNTLVQSWVEIARLARTTEGVQTTLFPDES